MITRQTQRFDAISSQRQNMFHPHDERVAEATEENTDKAAAGTLSLSFPFLVEQKSKATQSVEEDVHPVTGSKFRLCLFDRFHEKIQSAARRFFDESRM